MIIITNFPVSIKKSSQNKSKLILRTNLKSPEADYAVLPLFGVAFLTNIPLYAVFISLKVFRLIREKFYRNKKEKKTPEKTSYEETVKLKEAELEVENSDVLTCQSI
jgi:hypothetical protein